MDFLNQIGPIGAYILAAYAGIKLTFTYICKIVVVRTTHKGVVFKKGSEIRILNPGFHFYMPLISEVDIFPTVRQTTSLPPQAISSNDGEAIAARAVIVYEIKDMKAAFAESWDIEDTIVDIGMVALRGVITTKPSDTIFNEQLALDDELTGILKAGQLSRDYGVNILKAYFTNLAKTEVNSYLSEDTVSVLPKRS